MYQLLEPCTNVGLMDLPLTVDKDSSTPIFIQLSQCLKARILSGALKPGTLLPPTRDLANSLGLSRGTVLKAYDDLIAQGYLDATVGSGTFVSRRAQSETSARLELERMSQETQDGMINSLLSVEAKDLMAIEISHGVAGYNTELNYGAPPPDMLPLAKWKETLATQSRLQQPHHFDCTPETLGNYQLRKEIAAFLSRSKGLNCSAEQVVVFSGSQQGLNYLARILVNPGDTVVLENPGYGGARDNFSMRRANIVHVGVDANGLKVNELANIKDPVKIVYVSPSYHDPTGAIMSLDRRKALLEWASRRNAIIMEDAWDSDYSYVPPLPSLQGLDTEHRVIYLYTFWKVMFPLLTIGCAVMPPYLVPIIDRMKFITERQYPVLEHLTMADFMQSGALERHIKRTKSIYERRRKALEEALFGSFKTEVEIPRQSGGLHLCVRFTRKLDAPRIEHAAQEEGLPIRSSASYYTGTPSVNEYLIPFASLADETIMPVVTAFAERLGYRW